ncbi:hypothetical protein H2248_005757 [Termitomyces sp. 'cryptogamus']|nr:hypothetical protein H2248_005757 [Termitomyces sp. 'cryptogamus']
MAAQSTITEDTSAPNFEDCSPCSIESSATRVAPALVNPREDPHALTAEDLTVTPSLPRTDHAEMSTEVGSSTSEALVIPNEKDFCKRVVFRRRPRASNGKSIFNKTLPGKTAPNGIPLWGSTIFDFYYVECMPYGTHLSSISTGSKLMNWMKAKGEADHAKDEIAWAEMEEDPKIIDPRSPCVKIQEMEKMIKLGKAGEYVLKQDTTENDIFNSCSPWPFVPFSYETERLTSIIDLDHLVVHDPWNLLAVSSQNNLSLAASYKDQEWTSMEDITHVYKLNYRNVVSNRQETKSRNKSNGRGEKVILAVLWKIVQRKLVPLTRVMLSKPTSFTHLQSLAL